MAAARASLRQVARAPNARDATPAFGSSKRRPQRPRNHWLSAENRMSFVDTLATSYGVKRYADFYKIQLKQFNAEGGSALLEYYGGSMANFLSSMFPAYKFSPHRFGSSAKGFATNLDLIDAILSRIAVNHGARRFLDLQRIPSSHLLQDVEGASLLNQFQQSITTLLTFAYRSFRFRRFNFLNQSKSPWTEAQIDELIHSFGPKRFSSLYALRADNFESSQAGTLLAHFGESVAALIMSHYDGVFSFRPWRFGYVPSGYWKDLMNCRFFLESSLRNVTQFKDLNSLSQETLVRSEGANVLAFYANSPYLLLRASYPSYHFSPWLFALTPKDSIKDVESRFRLLLYLERKLNISALSDWQRVAKSQLIDVGVYHIVSKLGGLEALLAEAYPEHPWDFSFFSKRRR